MSRFDKFAKRYHKVKLGVQEIAAQNLANVYAVYETELSTLRAIMTTLETAKQEQTRIGITNSEMNSWSVYINRLEFEFKHQNEKIAALTDVIEEKRGLVKDAYTEQKKWSVIVERNEQERVGIMNTHEQREADERATIRHGRSV